jgi:uncharacterized membrane-anchored protein YhcB (DUF1043 family)
LTYPGKDEFLLVATQAFHLHITEVVKTNKISRLREEVIKPVQTKIISTKLWNLEAKGQELARLGKELLVDFNRLDNLTKAFRSEYACFYKRMRDSKNTLIEERAKIKWR